MRRIIREFVPELDAGPAPTDPCRCPAQQTFGKVATMSDTTGCFSIGDTTVKMPVKTGSLFFALRSSISASFMPRPECSPMTPDLRRRRAANCRSPISTATKVSCSTAVIRLIRSPNMATSAPAYLLLYGELPIPTLRKRISTTGSPATRWCTSRWPGFSRAPCAWIFLSDGCAVCERWGAVVLLRLY